MSHDDNYRAVMTDDPPARHTPFETAGGHFIFDEVWARPGLSIRDRRLVTLGCVAGVGAVMPTERHVYVALRSGDLTVEQLNEVTLHFAVYCGWPLASQLEGIVRAQWHRLATERGETPAPWPPRPDDELGPPDHAERIRGGQEEFLAVNETPAPPTDSPYFHAGILGFVFGHVWRRPGLSRRDRRLVTLACVGVAGAAMPIESHVGSALGTGDLTWEEVQEVILHFSTYCGMAKGQALHDAAQRWRASRA